MAWEYKPNPNLRDLPVDETKCRASVAADGWHYYQCRNPAKYDGKWCGVHHPALKAQRRRKN